MGAREEAADERLRAAETIFDLFVSGFSHQQIAKALGTSAGAVRRVIDLPSLGARLDGPERYACLQVARLMKALSHADFKLEKGDIRAFGPYMTILSDVGRYHELAPANPRRGLGCAEEVLPLPPLALTRAAPRRSTRIPSRTRSALASNPLKLLALRRIRRPRRR